MMSKRIREIFNKIYDETNEDFDFRKPKLYVVDDEDSANKGNRYIRGQYWLRSNKLLINKNQNLEEIKRTIRHELTHAITKSKVHTPKFKRIWRKIG